MVIRKLRGAAGPDVDFAGHMNDLLRQGKPEHLAAIRSKVPGANAQLPERVHFGVFSPHIRAMAEAPTAGAPHYKVKTFYTGANPDMARKLDQMPSLGSANKAVKAFGDNRLQDWFGNLQQKYQALDPVNSIRNPLHSIRKNLGLEINEMTDFPAWDEQRLLAHPKFKELHRAYPNEALSQLKETQRLVPQLQGPGFGHKIAALKHALGLRT